MFFRRKHLIEFGYKVMGLDFGSNQTLNHYVKYFPEHNSMVVFSTIYDNSVIVYELTKEQYDDFQDGKYALSHDGKGRGTTPSGYPVKNYGVKIIYAGGELSRIKYLKDILDVAEKIAQGEKIKYEFTIKRK